MSKPEGVHEDLSHPLIIKARSCSLCFGMGYFRATSLVSSGDFVFLCSCQAGHNCGKSFPLWTRALETKYLPDWKNGK